MVELALAVVVQNQVFWMQGRLTGDKGIRNCLLVANSPETMLWFDIVYLYSRQCVCACLNRQLYSVECKTWSH